MYATFCADFEIFWCCEILLLNKNVIKSGYIMDKIFFLHYVDIYFFTYNMLWSFNGNVISDT